MKIKIFKYYDLVDESPWLFFVATASLFLTLNAVLFFHFFIQGLYFFDQSFSFMVVSFMSLTKIKPKVLYLGGSVLANFFYNRYYSFRSIGIGNAKWDPNNYSKETQNILGECLSFMRNNDKDSVYDAMYAVLGNKENIFSQNYGKVTSVVNNMIFSYNKENPDYPITEKEFLERYSFSYSDTELLFLDKTNRGTIMSNVSEILAPKIVMNENKNMLVERCTVMQDKVNLSGQKNPEYTVGLFIKKGGTNETVLAVYDSDLKMTEDEALDKKILNLSEDQKLNTIVTFYDKSKFGINIIIVASRNNQDPDLEVVFSKEQVITLVNELKLLARKYPELFESFDENSKEFSEFKQTGKTSLLNKSSFPVTRYYRPSEYYKLPHNDTKFEETSSYKIVVDQINKREGSKIEAFLSLSEDYCKDDFDN